MARRAVTVLRQEAVDWDELPSGGRSEAGGTDVWVATGDRTGDGRSAERDGAVYTLVSEQVAGRWDCVALVDELPEADDDSAVEDVLDRARDACRDPRRHLHLALR